MAKALLITLYNEFNLGVRQLVSELRAEGHEAYLFCLKQYRKKDLALDDEWYPDWQTELTPAGGRCVLSYPYPLSDCEIQLLENLLKQLKPHFVGLSVYSAFVPQANQVTQIVRRAVPNALVGWGGPHVTLDPIGSTDFCDVAFVGECDLPLVEFMNALHAGRDWRQTPNIVWREQGKVHRQPVSPVVKDLDTLPFTFFGSEGAFYLEDDELIEGRSFPSSELNTSFKIMTTRGCPYACTFCMLSFQKEVMPDTSRLRFRSIEHCMRELEEAKARMGHYFMEIEDDIFTVRPDRMREFFKEYSRRIRMPFWCYTHPNYARPEMLQILKENHVEFIIMGIQTGSDRIATEVFDRRVTNATVLQAAKNIHEAGIRVFYDIISNNPFETEEDRIETFHLLRQIPKPYGLQMGILNFYPGIAISRMREERGLPRVADFQMYRFWNALYYLASTVDLSDEQAQELLHNEHFRRDPSLLESMVASTVRLTRESGELKSIASNYLREVHRLAERARELESELHYLKARRGLKQFLWLSDRLRHIKHNILGRRPNGGNGTHNDGKSGGNVAEARDGACSASSATEALAMPTNPSGERLAKQIGL
ncbi:MAG: B12-binding domain-containing radical SAM protein [Candidatus Sumerlaeaceae bacterium]|nr:B12-binding domain-containing radical SAM protein [Candidatus Sumerlaeaceae bacterium]